MSTGCSGLARADSVPLCPGAGWQPHSVLRQVLLLLGLRVCGLPSARAPGVLLCVVRRDPRAEEPERLRKLGADLQAPGL